MVVPRPDVAADLLSQGEVRKALGIPAGEQVDVAALSTRNRVYRLRFAGQDLILRLPQSATQLAVLQKEEAVQQGLRGMVQLRLPDVRLVYPDGGRLVMAVHSTIPGEPLTGEMYRDLVPAARDRLVADLVRFYRQTHGVPLEAACVWLGMEYRGEETLARLTRAQGKPPWFDAAAIGGKLSPAWGKRVESIFADTAAAFARLRRYKRYMVFGHGDLHGFNMAMTSDEIGPKLTGVFDLENAGIMDVHEDFFRLGLVSEDLLAKVATAYRRQPGASQLRDERLAVYYRAFLLYLMHEKVGERESYHNLESMLLKHRETNERD